MKHIAITAALLCALCAGVAGAAVYKWMDENGRVHYSQTKPADYPSEKLGDPAAPPSESFDLNKPFADQIRAGAAKKPAAVTPADAANAGACQTARGNLNALQNNARIRYTDADGNQVIMTEEVKQQKLQETLGHIDKYCE